MAKILFFGLGSIGRKHLSLLQQHFDHELFAFRTHEGDKINQYAPSDINNLHTSWHLVDVYEPDIAFICNPTYLHIDTAIKCAERGMHLFIEKPIDCTTHRLDELLRIVQNNKLTSYIAYDMRFHPRIQGLKWFLENEACKRSKATCFTNLAKWRPYQTYSAHRDQGGGALLELSHELDYINWFFGIKKITGYLSGESDLTDAESCADLWVEHGKGATKIQLDIDLDVEKRSFQVSTQGLNVKAEFYPNDNIYLEQLRYFFNNIGNPRMMNNLEDAAPLFRKIIEFRDHAI